MVILTNFHGYPILSVCEACMLEDFTKMAEMSSNDHNCTFDLKFNFWDKRFDHFKAKINMLGQSDPLTTSDLDTS